MSVTTETLTLAVGDGTKMQTYVARPEESGRRPAVLVLQEAFGVTEHIQDVTRRFAEAGYVAAAPELFHRTAAGQTFAYDNFPAIMPHMQAVKEDTLVADLKAVHAFFQDDRQADGARVGAVGYCMGGRAAWIANAKLPLKAAVSYYGGGIAPALAHLAKEQHGPVLLVWGGLDKHIGPDARRGAEDALIEAKKTAVHATFSNADHGFNCNDRSAFQADAARQAWALTREFFATYL